METTPVVAAIRESSAVKAETKRAAKEKREPQVKTSSGDREMAVEAKKKEEFLAKSGEEGQGPGKTEEKGAKLGFEFELSTKKLTFQVDDETEKVIVKVVDAKSGEEIRQIPPEELVDLAERLEKYKGRIINRVL